MMTKLIFHKYETIEDAVSNGISWYWDQEWLKKNKSGGTRCPKCKTWETFPRKRKTHQPTYLDDCEKCEIKEPFGAMWHKFNKVSDDEDRKMFNKWLHEMRFHINNLKYYVGHGADPQARLKELIESIPFLEV